jgi:hypothetical protein
MTSTEWCCVPFENLLSRAGERGISIYARHNISIGARKFCLQARPIEKYLFDEIAQGKHTIGENLSQITDSYGEPVSISLTMEQPIKNCPFCGCHLIDVINKNLELFDNIAIIDN